MKKKVSRKAKRRFTALTCLLVAIVIALGTGFFSNWAIIIENKRQVALLSEEYNEMVDKQKSLESEVTKLQDPDYVARYAREKYLYSKDGELIIRIPESDAEDE